MTLKTKKWDAAEDIRDDDDARYFLEEFLKDGTAEELVEAIQTVARAKGMTLLAEQMGMSREQLYEVLNPYGGPTRGALVGLLKTLGITGQPANSDAAE